MMSKYVILRHFFYEYYYSYHKLAFQNIIRAGDQKLTRGGHHIGDCTSTRDRGQDFDRADFCSWPLDRTEKHALTSWTDTELHRDRWLNIYTYTEAYSIVATPT